MSIKNIRQELIDAGIDGNVKYLKENEKGRHEST